MPKRAPEAVDHHHGWTRTPGVDVVQPLAIDLDELTAWRHRGFNLPRGVSGEQDQTRNDQEEEQNQSQQNIHVRHTLEIRGPSSTTEAAAAPSGRRLLGSRPRFDDSGITDCS